MQRGVGSGADALWRTRTLPKPAAFAAQPIRTREHCVERRAQCMRQSTQQCWGVRAVMSTTSAPPLRPRSFPRARPRPANVWKRPEGTTHLVRHRHRVGEFRRRGLLMSEQLALVALLRRLHQCLWAAWVGPRGTERTCARVWLA